MLQCSMQTGPSAVVFHLVILRRGILIERKAESRSRVPRLTGAAGRMSQTVALRHGHV
jgi:hypothetical protein